MVRCNQGSSLRTASGNRGGHQEDARIASGCNNSKGYSARLIPVIYEANDAVCLLISSVPYSGSHFRSRTHIFHFSTDFLFLLFLR